MLLNVFYVNHFVINIKFAERSEIQLLLWHEAVKLSTWGVAWWNGFFFEGLLWVIPCLHTHIWGVVLEFENSEVQMLLCCLVLTGEISSLTEDTGQASHF